MEVFFTLIYFMSRRSKLTATFFRFVVTFRQSRAITKLRFASPRCRETENADLPVRIHLPRNSRQGAIKVGNKDSCIRQSYVTLRRSVVRRLCACRDFVVLRIALVVFRERL